MLSFNFQSAIFQIEDFKINPIHTFFVKLKISMPLVLRKQSYKKLNLDVDELTNGQTNTISSYGASCFTESPENEILYTKMSDKVRLIWGEAELFCYRNVYFTNEWAQCAPSQGLRNGVKGQIYTSGMVYFD